MKLGDDPPQHLEGCACRHHLQGVCLCVSLRLFCDLHAVFVLLYLWFCDCVKFAFVSHVFFVEAGTASKRGLFKELVLTTASTLMIGWSRGSSWDVIRSSAPCKFDFPHACSHGGAQPPSGQPSFHEGMAYVYIHDSDSHVFFFGKQTIIYIYIYIYTYYLIQIYICTCLKYMYVFIYIFYLFIFINEYIYIYTSGPLVSPTWLGVVPSESARFARLGRLCGAALGRPGGHLGRGPGGGPGGGVSGWGGEGGGG